LITCRKDSRAAAVIWSAYFGYCCAMASAPADFGSCAWTPSVIFEAFVAPAMAALTAAAYPAESSAPKTDA
jgi:hypothetical protein